MTHAEEMIADGCALAMYDQKLGLHLFHIGGRAIRLPLGAVRTQEWRYGLRVAWIGDVLRAERNEQ